MTSCLPPAIAIPGKLPTATVAGPDLDGVFAALVNTLPTLPGAARGIANLLDSNPDSEVAVRAQDIVSQCASEVLAKAVIHEYGEAGAMMVSCALGMLSRAGLPFAPYTDQLNNLAPGEFLGALPHLAFSQESLEPFRVQLNLCATCLGTELENSGAQWELEPSRSPAHLLLTCAMHLPEAPPWESGLRYLATHYLHHFAAGPDSAPRPYSLDDLMPRLAAAYAPAEWVKMLTEQPQRLGVSAQADLSRRCTEELASGARLIEREGAEHLLKAIADPWDKYDGPGKRQDRQLGRLAVLAELLRRDDEVGIVARKGLSAVTDFLYSDGGSSSARVVKMALGCVQTQSPFDADMLPKMEGVVIAFCRATEPGALRTLAEGLSSNPVNAGQLLVYMFAAEKSSYTVVDGAKLLLALEALNTAVRDKYQVRYLGAWRALAGSLADKDKRSSLLPVICGQSSPSTAEGLLVWGLCGVTLAPPVCREIQQAFRTRPDDSLTRESLRLALESVLAGHDRCKYGEILMREVEPWLRAYPLDFAKTALFCVTEGKYTCAAGRVLETIVQVGGAEAVARAICEPVFYHDRIKALNVLSTASVRAVVREFYWHKLRTNDRDVNQRWANLAEYCPQLAVLLPRRDRVLWAPVNMWRQFLEMVSE